MRTAFRLFGIPHGAACRPPAAHAPPRPDAGAPLAARVPAPPVRYWPLRASPLRCKRKTLASTLAPTKFADRSRWNRGAAARGVREDWLGAHGAGGRGWRGGCAGEAARDDSIAPMPPRRRPPGVADEKRRSDGAGTSGRSVPTRPSPVKVRPISGNKGRGRSESAWTAKRQGVKAIWRLPNPRDARRNMRLSQEPRPPEI